MVSAYQKSLAEFAARRRQRNKIIFSRDMCVRENTARAASVEFVRHRRTNYARSRPQAFCRKNPEGFSTVSDRPRRRSLFAGILAPASCKRIPHTPQVSLHQSAAGPPPFRQGRLWGREMRITTGAVRPRNDRVSMECGAWQAGDREGRPYGGLQGVPCGRADRGVRPYGWVIDGAVCGGTHGSRPTLHYFVGQGPCALPGVREKPVGPM